VVVGAGIVGAAVARELAVRGVRVCLLDRGAVSSGTTGLGEGNVLVADKRAGPELDLVREGLAVYRELDDRLGAEARIRRKGALVVHTDEPTWAAEPARIAGLGVPAQLVGPDELRRLEPALTGAALGATVVPGDLQCDPRAIARALAREAAEAGALVRTGVAVHAVALAGGRGSEARAARVGTAGEGVWPGPSRGGASAHRLAGRAPAIRSGTGGRVSGVDTSEGRIEAGAVVLAAGPWTAPLAERAGLPLPLEPRKGQLVRLRAPHAGFVRHKVLDASYLAAVESADPALQLSTVVESTWEGDVLVGSSRERAGFDTAVDPAVGAAMVERAARLFPALRALEVLDAWAGLRPWLPGNLPAIGPSARVPGLWLAAGHEGAGVALGPVTGRMVAQLLCGEPPVVDPAPFAPDRFTPG
jgi:glycine/D-amino acid oxidase-like deaminating enzyme